MHSRPPLLAVQPREQKPVRVQGGGVAGLGIAIRPFGLNTDDRNQSTSASPYRSCHGGQRYP